MTPASLYPDYEAAIPVPASSVRAALLNSVMRLSHPIGQVASLPHSLKRPTYFARYQALGLQLVFWDRNSDPQQWKGPHVPGWQKTDFPIVSYRPGQQVGVKLATELQP